jgi:hypothetical protein
MGNQLRVASVVHQMLRLPYWRNVVSMAVSRPTPANEKSANKSLWARLFAQTAVVEDGVAEANGAATADSTRVGNRSDSLRVEDVPMPHLFLLDMKIGR